MNGQKFALAPKTKDLLRQALIEKYGQLPLFYPTEYGQMLAEVSSKVTRPIVLASGKGFVEMLRQVGCENAINYIGITKFDTDGDLPIRVPKKSTMVKYLAEIAGHAGIQFIHEEEEGKTSISLSNPELFKSLGPDTYLALPEPHSMEEQLLSVISYFLNQGCGSIQLQIARPHETITHTFLGNQHLRDSQYKGEYEIKVSTSVEKLNNKEQKITLHFAQPHRPDAQNYLMNGLQQEVMGAMADLKIQKPPESMTGEETNEEIHRLRKQLAKVTEGEKKTQEISHSIRQFVAGKLDLKELLYSIQTGEYRSRAYGTTREGLELGVRRLGSYDSETRFHIRINGIGLNPAGYFREGNGNELLIADGGVKWMNTETDFTPSVGVSSKPTDWMIAPTIQLSKDEWTAIPIRVDMNDITYVQQNGLEVEIDKANRIVRAKGVNEEVPFYQRKVKTSLFRERKPVRADSLIHCRIEDLEKNLATELIRIRDSTHSAREKAALILSLQESRYQYNDDPNIEQQIMNGVQDIGDFERSLLNTSAGTCNYAATSVALMLRLCNMPVKVEAGSVAGSKVSRMSDTHLWPTFWDGREWIAIEGVRGSISPSITLDFSQGHGVRAASLTSSFGLLNRHSSPLMWSKVIGGELTSNIRASLQAISQTPALMKELVEMLSSADSRSALETLLKGLMLTTAETVESGAAAFAQKQREDLNVLIRQRENE